MPNAPAIADAPRPRSSSTPRRPISVVHMVLSVNIGGLEKVVYDLVRSVDRRRFPARILCLSEVGALGPAFEKIGVPVESLGVHDQGPLRGIRAAARRLRELRPDILHTHNSVPHLVGAPAGWLGGVPVVVHTRHGRHLFKGWKERLANGLASRLTRHVVAVSNDAADVARKCDRIPEEKLDIIWNGIDLDEHPASRGIARRGSRAIHVARLEETVKDQSTLLRAVRIVADAEPQFAIDIVGDGPSRAALEALCDELRLRRHVHFLGPRHDVRKLLEQSCLFALSSTSEGLSISVLEAMAAGLPVVATDVGGNPEVVIHGETGLLVPARSPEKLAAAVLELWRDFQRAERMGQAGRVRVEEHFDLRRVAAKYEALYSRLAVV